MVLTIALFLCAVGILQIYSATRDTGFHSAWWRQIIFVLGGLVLSLDLRTGRRLWEREIATGDTLWLAGDWVRSELDFPCMETAVRTGLAAADAVLKALK